MGHQELDHWPYLAYQDDSGNLYVHDRDEGLVFVRSKVCHNNYGLLVIIEEDNPEYWRYTDILSPTPPCGFQIFDEINLNEWNCLVRDYIRNKHAGEKVFTEWLRQKLYAPLENMLFEESWFAESMPCPGAPKEEWRDFDRLRKEFHKQEVSS